MDSCSHRKCVEPVVAKGLCKKHYNAEYWRTRQGVPRPRPAVACKRCADRAVAKGFCAKHYSANRYALLVKGRPLSLRKKRSNRNCELRKRYGITLEQFEEMAAKQKGRCAVCRQPPRNKHGLCLDHCHRTGRVRGLLCAGCNTAIGVLERDKRWTAAALNYLKAAAA